MHRPILFVVPIVFIAALVAAPQCAQAQADARAAFAAGKAAFEKGQFQKARDSFLAAAQTDNRNPEAFLWLGKAHYQLGEIDQAMAAWRRTIRLAPDEPYSAKMLKALSGELAEVDKRIQLVEAMAAEKLYAVAIAQCRSLLGDKAATDAQRVKVMLLKAAAEVESSKAADAARTLADLGVRYPAAARSAEAMLQLGRAKVRLGGRGLAEGVALLKRVAGGPAKPQAAWAQYELLAHELGRNVTPAGTAAMKKWLDGHADHPRATAARNHLVDAYLTLSTRLAAASADTKLSGHDTAAIAVVGELLGKAASPKEADSLARRIMMHLESRYGKAGAHGAVIAGVTALTKAPLPLAARREAMRRLAACLGELALRQLTDLGKAGKMLDGDMPKPLADAVAAWGAVTREFPATPAWADLAALAERTRGLAKYVTWPDEITRPKAPMRWAVGIALRIVKADADAAAVKSAVGTVTAVVAECEKFRRPPARGIALAVHTELLSATSPDSGAWQGVMLKQIDLLNSAAAGAFQDNLKAGRGEANAKLGDSQKEMLKVMAGLVEREVSYSSTVLGKLGSHLGPWVSHGHYTLAEQAYTQLAAALAEAQKREARLWVVQLRVHQVAREHNRLLRAGRKVPRQLAAAHVRALRECFALQSGLDEGDAFANSVRKVWDGIIRHYQDLEYFDLAEQAIKVRPEAKPPADSPAVVYAELGLADFHYAQARRELDEFLTRYGAAEKVALTDAFKRAIADYTKFISDHPRSPLVPRAISGVINIAQIFQQHRSYDAAVGVYREFAAFASKVKVLSHSAPGATSTAEGAEVSAAGTLYAKAQEALAKWQSAREPGSPPPAKISDEFAAAIEAYKAFIEAKPTGAAAGAAIRRIMAAALEYAKVNAWDVADAIYADLLAGEAALRKPERIEFCRGLCRLGKVLPDHARGVLTALTSAPPGGSKRLSLGYFAYGGEEKEGDKKWRMLNGKDLEKSVTFGDLPGNGPTNSGRGRPTGGARPAKPKPPAITATPPAEPAAELGAAKADEDELHRGDALAIAAIRKQHELRASRIAALRDHAMRRGPSRQTMNQSQKQTRTAQRPSVPVLSAAELKRRSDAFDAAYRIFQAIRKAHPHTTTARQARGEIMVMIDHWRSVTQWRRAAELAARFLADNPTDLEMPKLRLAMARDTLSWAAKPISKSEKLSRQAMLAEVAGRFEKARTQLADIVEAFTKPLDKEKSIVHQAQWDIANSFLTQARVVNAFSPTLARGQYVRAAKELLAVARRFHDHPKIGSVPQMLWTISQELAGRAYHDQAITVWNDLTIRYPTHSLSRQAALRIAQTYQNNLGRPLKAAEAYLELNFARGGGDTGIQTQIHQIGSKLKSEKRWVEALHVLEVFVDSFPRHASAGAALTMVGQIHQANEAWADAIAAYKRVIDEFPGGTWVRDAKWAIAECTINLSRWREAMKAYESYLSAYGKNAKDTNVAEAKRRIGILKDLARYQALVDEKGQRKAFDAQYQIAEIVAGKLSNPVKAIIEYRKVAARWQDSHLADDAMFKIGTTYLSMGETTKAREALLAVGAHYPNSPLADDALYMVGQSYENEARKLVTVTRARTLQLAQEQAQKKAYKAAQSARDELRRGRFDRISQLRKGGQKQQAELEVARGAAEEQFFQSANVSLAAQRAGQEVVTLTAAQLADRQDKMNAALRKAVTAYQKAAQVAAADKADDSLLRMAVIYAEKMKDPEAAMKTYQEIVRQFSGTSVAEDASWRIAQYHESRGKYAEAITAYKAFLRNYRRSPKAGAAQFAVAENYEHLGKWVDAMDAYTNYINNFASGPLVDKAKKQINWIKTYRL